MNKLKSKSLQHELSLVSKKVAAAQSNVEINSVVEELITTALDAEFCSFWFYDEANLRLLRDRDNDTLKILSLDEKTGIIYKCFMTKEPKIYNYLASDRDYVPELDNPDNIKIKSKIIYPLVDDMDRLVGIVTAYNSIKRAKKFYEEDLRVLKAIAPYLIDITYKMHPCEDESCYCRKTKPKVAETKAKENIKELETAGESVESSDEMLNSMSNFIHDIRTPSNTLQGFLELLEDQITDKRLKEYLLNAKESARFINELTTSMLDRMSLRHEKEGASLKEINTAHFFANIAEMFVSNMYNKRIHFSVYIDPLLPKTIEVDELKLKRVIMNLIGNAYKFTPYNKSIEFAVKYNKQTKDATIYVKDKGIGIAKDKQAQIFEAYKQAEDTTSQKYGGTGLGLSICAEYVECLGGKLELQSELDKGSVFYFTMPLHIKEDIPTLSPIEDNNLKITVLMDSKNSFTLLNMARYLVQMSVDKNRVEAVSSVSEIPDDTTHLIVFQHKLDQSVHEVIAKFPKVLIVEEDLFSMNADELDDNCELMSQHGYFADDLYKYINSNRAPKVLIVDDDKTSILLLEKILENEYCDIDVAENGKLALEMIIDAHKKLNPYSVVYIDNKMPLMTGLEVLSHVREFEQDNNLKPIYAVSTSGDLLDLEKEGKNFDAYVGKPFRVSEIKNFLNNSKEM